MERIFYDVPSMMHESVRDVFVLKLVYMQQRIEFLEMDKKVRARLCVNNFQGSIFFSTPWKTYVSSLFRGYGQTSDMKRVNLILVFLSVIISNCCRSWKLSVFSAWVKFQVNFTLSDYGIMFQTIRQ